MGLRRILRRMKTMTRALITLVGAGLLLPGCVILDRVGSKRAGIRADQCHPSQYWDGTQCRHKGKGKGARKHDDD